MSNEMLNMQLLACYSHSVFICSVIEKICCVRLCISGTAARGKE